MSKLDELIGATKQMEVEFDRNAILNTQMVLGKERKVCVGCGFCPSALLQELEAAREALSNNNGSTDSVDPRSPSKGGKQ